MLDASNVDNVHVHLKGNGQFAEKQGRSSMISLIRGHSPYMSAFDLVKVWPYKRTTVFNALDVTRMIDFDSYQNCSDVLQQSYRIYTCHTELPEYLVTRWRC